MNDDIEQEVKQNRKQMEETHRNFLEGLANVPETKPPYVTRGLPKPTADQVGTQELTKVEANRRGAEAQSEETFTPAQVEAAIEQFLKFGADTYQRAHEGYFSGAGWAARCLSFHYRQLKRAHIEHQKLLAFTGAVLNEHRGEEIGDVDGGVLQDLAEKHGLLEYKEVKEPCGEGCTCAYNTEFPTHCYFYSELGKRAIAAARPKPTPTLPTEGTETKTT